MHWLTHSLIALTLSATLQAAPEPAPAANKPAAAQQAPKKTDSSFKPFTAKVVANKVRIRLKPDTESHIIRQFNKNDLLLIVGEEGNFYAVQPPKETKAYVFRSYILDNLVEANRVNVRLEPHVDAPIIGQLQAGARVEGQVCPLNHKWMEIAPPASAKFYVCKEFVTHVGGSDFIVTMEKRKQKVEELVTGAYAAADAECKKGYEEMSLESLLSQFQSIVRDYADFPQAVSQAKEGIALVKQTYLQKKIDFLESKAELSPTAKEELLAKHKAENKDLFSQGSPNISPDLFSKRVVKQEMGDQARFWDAMEECLYLSWTAFHSGKKIDDFYAEQKANAQILTGTLEPYTHSVKNRPGDYILRKDEAPIAYLYSTAINLEKYKGKEITVVASPRPNNHFAFPAYFVLNIE